jgi:circadian clock protein KaiC
MPVGSTGEIKSMLMRLVDMLKTDQITALFTSLSNARLIEETDIGISSLIDTWLLLRDIEANGERNRGLYVLKSRGMSHSNQIREFLITDRGIDLVEAYLGPSGVLTGSARLAQEAQERALEERRSQSASLSRRRSERRRLALEARIAALQAALEGEQDETQLKAREDRDLDARLVAEREIMARSRSAGTDGRADKSRKEADE